MSGNGFDPKDVAEICSRKKSKFRMKKADFKELGRNALVGTFDVIFSAVKVAEVIARSQSSQTKSKNEYKSPITYSWEKRGIFRDKDGF
ncbi:hypothetical protein LU631_07450 [Erwinia tracheiphila]|uniref:Uncharacterized protein n=1 Tax=Erwinia tracheiphila TaxID=65700 RepID=A0A0M2KFH8_9GAMM|nr:hypothetical protein [Erwinia tracheiphila]EOS93047.1 hypothetical protein ETR_21162 [Erwinia tracheiphila PSU-1]KKF37694.1 hypothetical protein SY86_23490 [Erwinia tracheiphila]UIA89090.1 hypothetical protein LU631_07450 [Erwinia tracheiphila]UIA97474.1 hypothetical protein LU633_06130 [Erwinia tracheiphila]